MFENTLVDHRGTSRKSWSVVVSFLAQSLLVCVAILIPLLSTDVLPAQRWVSFLLEPPRPPAGPAPAPEVRRSPQPQPERIADSAFQAPSLIPEKVALITEERLPVQTAPKDGPVPVAGGMPGGVRGALLGINDEPLRVAPPPDPDPKAEETTVPRLVPVGGKVQAAKLVHRVSPLYPALARQARISGVVLLEAIIAIDGTIRDLRVLQGHPLLARGAIDAVRQWRYQPTLLNGLPVEVITQVEVNYTLR